ncbi:hypothetical protein [Psychromonas sp. KJ10-2]|uniref:hypothetical protein n=1 Tax=Psychromonas sp. KJ10-2 TaxID=3391822 RepID=UPI0039B5535F
MKSSNDDSFNKPPKHIRHICMVNSKESEREVLERINALKDAYAIAFITQLEIDNKPIDNVSIKYPIRFPLFRERIRQINLSVNNAYSSVSIKKGQFHPIK